MSSSREERLGRCQFAGDREGRDVGDGWTRDVDYGGGVRWIDPVSGGGSGFAGTEPWVPVLDGWRVVFRCFFFLVVVGDALGIGRSSSFFFRFLLLNFFLSFFSVICCLWGSI